jgi:Zn-dependent peptidase ImmA (M78 family)
MLDSTATSRWFSVTDVDRRRPPLPIAVREQVAAMFIELESRWPGGTEQLSAHTVDALSDWGAIEVRMVPESAADVGCSVAGAYLYDNVRPIVAIAESASPGRRAFTGGHELGHHLQQTTDHLIEALLKPNLDSHALEEAACNSFAAQLLIPEHLTSHHIGTAGPTVHDIEDLWRAGHASRQAVCARAAERLPAPGHVLLLDGDGLVTFSSSHGEFPIGRGSDQSQIPVVVDQLRHDGTQSGKTRIAYRDGITGSELYAQTTDLDGYIVVVAVVDHAPWLPFSPPSRDTDPIARSWVCGNCGHEFESWERRCNKCSVPKCPECRNCDCQPAKESRCGGCFQLKGDHLFDTGSDLCRDCA